MAITTAEMGALSGSVNLLSVPDPSWYAVLIVGHVAGPRRQMAICIRALVYIPLSILVALTLTGPRVWTRDWLASVALGIAGVGFLIALLTAVPIVQVLASPGIRALRLGSFSRLIMEASFWASNEVSAAMSAFTWMLARYVTFRNRHWLWLEPIVSGSAATP